VTKDTMKKWKKNSHEIAIFSPLKNLKKNINFKEIFVLKKV